MSDDLTPEDYVDAMGQDWCETWGKEMSSFQARMLAAMDRRTKQYIPGQTAWERSVINRIIAILRKAPGYTYPRLRNSLNKKGEESVGVEELNRLLRALVKHKKIAAHVEGNTTHLYIAEHCEQDEEGNLVPMYAYDIKRRWSPGYERHKGWHRPKHF